MEASRGYSEDSAVRPLSPHTTLLHFYVPGIPLTCVLGVRMGFGKEGLWWSINSGLCAITIRGAVAILCSNWTKPASEAALRLNDD